MWTSAKSTSVKKPASSSKTGINVVGHPDNSVKNNNAFVFDQTQKKNGFLQPSLAPTSQSEYKGNATNASVDKQGLSQSRPTLSPFEQKQLDIQKQSEIVSKKSNQARRDQSSTNMTFERIKQRC